MRILTLLFVGLTTASMACGSSSSDKACTLVYCESGVRLDREITVAAADVAKLTLTICRNGECSSGKFSSGSGGPQPCSLSGQLQPTICSLAPKQSGTGSFTVQLSAKNATDGDEYTFKIVRDDTGAAILDEKKSVVYTTSQPNGPDCEPTCKFAML